MTPLLRCCLIGAGFVILMIGVWMMANGTPFAIVAATAGGALIGFIFVKPKQREP
jgi:hypothetical protein